MVSLYGVQWSTVYHITQTNTELSTNLRRKFPDGFLADWCSVRKTRMDWKLLLKPCKSALRWSDKNWNKTARTSAKSSYIMSWDIKPAGQFSRFVIQSRSFAGVRKEKGGDSWRVHIRGTAWISPAVVDQNDGTYEVLFLPMEPGNYTADVFLDYSLCDGYRDPPDDWFIQGTCPSPPSPLPVTNSWLWTEIH